MTQQSGFALVVPHLLMGDQIVMIPAVRYLRLRYQEVHVWSLKKIADQVKMFYADDPQIKVITVTDKWWRDPAFYVINGIGQYNPKHVYPCGIHTEYIKGIAHAPCDHVPFCFYRHMGLSPEIYWNYFQIADCSGSHDLSKLLEEEYIFTHPRTSSGPVFNITDIEQHSHTSKDTVLMIDPNHNHYSLEHKFYQLAQLFIDHPINDYSLIMIHASRIYVSDSAFFCLAMQLGLKTEHCYLRPRCGNYSYIWNPEYGYKQQVGFGYPASKKHFSLF